MIQLFGVREQDVNTFDDNVIDFKDAPVTVVDNNLTIGFDGENSLKVLGVSELAVNDDVLFA